MPMEIRTPAIAGRPVWRSIVRGIQNRCPNCGKGRVLRGYLTPVKTCEVCGEDLSHQRSDDFGPYLTMVVVGHLVVPILLAVMLSTVIDPIVLLAVALPATAILAFALLRPIKGGIIGLQWALRMDGFDGSANPDAPEDVLAVPAPAARQPLPKTGLARK
jgi:uncharacterized protein (DUF983 family)